MTAMDSRLELLYGALADLEDRDDLTERQKTATRTQLLWSAVIVKRRETSLLANGRFLGDLLLRTPNRTPGDNEALEATVENAAAGGGKPGAAARRALRRFGRE